MNLHSEYLVLATLQQRRLEAERYRLTHPEQGERPSRAARRRRAWPHLPDFSALAHHGRRTPPMLGWATIHGQARCRKERPCKATIRRAA